MDDEKFIPTRKSLLGRLSDQQDNVSWREFFNTYWRLIYSVAIKSGCTESEAEEVVQETIISVSKTMPEFKYDPAVCSFKGWLMHITRWRIADQLRRRSPMRVQPLPDESEPPAGAHVAQEAPELEALWQREWERSMIDAAMERVKKRVTAQQYQIFHLHLVKQMSLREIAELLQIHLGRVYLAKHRVSRLVRKEIRDLEKRI
jgi:RNA polymerase sigma factor (sigma-70 family)